MKPAITIPDLHWYASQLLFIPPTLDRGGSGEARAREIGEEIFRRYGHQSMVAVCEFVRDQCDRVLGANIEAAWDGIGDWLG